ncbi:MAG: hypothetical protein SFZ02_12260 [bacterium]|nr:hypothetical protein [bacterium]
MTDIQSDNRIIYAVVFNGLRWCGMVLNPTDFREEYPYLEFATEEECHAHMKGLGYKFQTVSQLRDEIRARANKHQRDLLNWGHID